MSFGFTRATRLADTTDLADAGGRTGVIHTPHGDIRTPAFIAVGTQASVKTVSPEQIRAAGAQAVLANAYHLYLRPGSDLIDAAGGLGAFMHWDGPTFTDSGGFQVMSLGVGFKKMIQMAPGQGPDDEAIAADTERLAVVDDDGVTFKSHLDGTKHRFTPEVSMRVQHEIGADVMFAFDELTTLMNTRGYQERSLERTRRWAERCLAAHVRLTAERADKPYQALFGVLQGAQYEDLRRRAARDLAAMEIDGQVFDGFGLGGALEKHRLGAMVGWMCSELPEDKPRHLLGISEPEDFFAAIEAGADTFDCVQPSRVARNAAIYHPDGRFNITAAAHRRDFGPIDPDCGCYTCQHYSRAYVHHLFRAKEMFGFTLATIHNEHFTLDLVERIRGSIETGEFAAFRTEFLGRFSGGARG